MSFTPCVYELTSLLAAAWSRGASGIAGKFSQCCGPEKWERKREQGNRYISWLAKAQVTSDSAHRIGKEQNSVFEGVKTQ